MRGEYRTMTPTFRCYPNSYEIIDHLVDKLNDELQVLKQNKKTGIKWWSDIRYARYDEQRFIYMQQIRYLRKLYKEVERADLSEQAAIDGTYSDPPF